MARVRGLPAALRRLVHTAPREWVAFRVTPDKLLTNEHTEQLAKALWEAHQSLGRRLRMSRDGLTYRPPDAFAWEIEITDLLRFRLAAPQAWAGYVREHLQSCWPRATLTEDDTSWPVENLSAAYLRQKNHYCMSLNVRDGLAPVEGIRLAVRDFRNTEAAWVQVVMMPEADSWTIPATEAYETARQGGFVPPAHVDAKTIVKEVAFRAACGLQEGLDFLTEVLTGANRETKLERTHRIPGQTILTHHSRDKLGKSAFKATVRLIAQSPDAHRREAMIRSLAVAFRALAGDNELERVDVPPHRLRPFLGQMRGRVLPLDSMTLSTAEVGCLLRMPPAELQDATVDSLAFREVGPAEPLRRGGIALGTVTHRGERIEVFWPTDNRDELCLPRVVIGGMGSGKTTYGATFALSAAAQGYSVFAFDVADGRLCDLIRDGIDDPGQLRIIDLGLTDWPIGLDWHESVRGVDAMNRLSAECASYFSRFADETGGRTRRWLRAAAKAVYGRPGATLLEVVLMLISPVYRAQIVPTLTDPILREMWEQFDQMSDGERRQFVQPVLNRLDYLLDDDALKHILCMPSKPEIDWRRWADDGSVVLVRVPKNRLGDMATDALMSFLIRKLWLAILTRQDQPLNARKPCFCVMDEPHQYMSGSAQLWEQMVVEARQWRLGLVWMFHSFGGQFPANLRRIIEAAGPHYLLLNSGKETYTELQQEIAPYTIDEAMHTPAYWGICRARAGGNVVDPFLLRLPPEPKRLADRSKLNLEHAKRYGRPVSEVERDILERERVIYQAMMGGRKRVRGNQG